MMMMMMADEWYLIRADAWCRMDAKHILDNEWQGEVRKTWQHAAWNDLVQSQLLGPLPCNCVICTDPRPFPCAQLHSVLWMVCKVAWTCIIAERWSCIVVRWLPMFTILKLSICRETATWSKQGPVLECPFQVFARHQAESHPARAPWVAG